MERKPVRYGTLRLVQFLIITLLVVHWLACLFYLIAAFEIGEEPHIWTDQIFSFYQRSNFDMYIAAMYWAMMTVTTIGYGDIYPVTSLERGYVMVAMFIGAAIFAYVMPLFNPCAANRAGHDSRFI